MKVLATGSAATFSILYGSHNIEVLEALLGKVVEKELPSIQTFVETIY